MIYFDNSATSWPKPDRVYRGVYEFMKKYAANPGRSGHTMSQISSSVIYECRELLANMFCITDCSSVIFTKNTTEALNIVIKGVLKPGDHVITTSMEHNSVLRPLDKLSKHGVKFDVVKADLNGFVNPSDIENKITNLTKLIIVNHVSNVCGTIQDIDSICDIAHKHGILFAVDAAQSAGVLNIGCKPDFIALAGHKGLYGPMGTGALCINCDYKLSTLIEGGTGSYSEYISQPDELPDMFESGTLNAPGIAGLCEGLKFVNIVGVDNIRHHETMLLKYFIEGLHSIKGIKVYGPCDISKQTAVVAFNKNNMDCVTVSQLLNDKFHIASRSGYHCAYNAHKTIGSGDLGAVRFSFGKFNTRDEVSKALMAINLL